MPSGIIKAIQLLSVTVNTGEEHDEGSKKTDTDAFQFGLDAVCIKLKRDPNERFVEISENIKLLSDMLFQHRRVKSEYDIVTHQNIKKAILKAALLGNINDFSDVLSVEEEYKILDKFWVEMWDVSEMDSVSKYFRCLTKFSDIYKDFRQKFNYYSAILKILFERKAFIVDNNECFGERLKDQLSFASLYSSIQSMNDDVRCKYKRKLDKSLKNAFNLMVKIVKDIQTGSNNVRDTLEGRRYSRSLIKKHELIDIIISNETAFYEYSDSYIHFDNRCYSFILSIRLTEKFRDLLVVFKNLIRSANREESHGTVKRFYYRYDENMKDLIVILINMAVSPEYMNAFINEIKNKYSKYGFVNN